MATHVWFRNNETNQTLIASVKPDDDWGEIHECPVCKKAFIAETEQYPLHNQSCPVCAAPVVRVLEVFEGGHSLTVQQFQKQVQAVRR